EVIGPVMIGPSSSHTAGAARLGLLARTCWGKEPFSASVHLHGSFATTGRGHGTNKALLAGLMGMKPDDPRIRDAFAEAEKRGLEYEFHDEEKDGAHPNSARFVFRSSDGQREMEITGASLGGGAVRIEEIDGFSLNISGTLPTVVTFHKDSPGVVSVVASVLTGRGVNIATLSLARQVRGGLASMAIEMDGVFPDMAETVLASHPSLIRAILVWGEEA
ncbi:MAG: L-serine ammonia-lyase, iron-sulfur-dependent subunit beta, partial [Synergistota bacterium]|nr:L-serine ammonia-lyase, iron-sulfur-dependent subunit beta [Synergistota bacterium]